MIYGNPNAKSESNGNAVFELFDVQGIVGFWHMDEPQWTGTTGEVRDETGVNHGTAYGGATTTSDAKFGRAGLFDGDDEYVEVPDSDSLDITDAITIEFWGIVKAQSPKEQHFVSKGGNKYLFYVGPNSYRLIFWFGDTDPHSYGYYILTPNVWTHVVGTYDKDGGDNNYKVYINGELHHQYTLTGAIGVDSSPLCVGRMGSAADRFLNGLIDELRIYNRALSPTEIQILSKNYMQKMGSYFNVRKYVTPAPVVIV